MSVIGLSFVDEEMPRDRPALLLKHFSRIEDEREPWRVMYPLGEVLMLVTCATIAACDDFDDIVAWGEHHLDFLRRFAPFHHGIPCARWLRILVNRIDPILFKRCFEGWVGAIWPERPEFIAIDGKTSRRTHDGRRGSNPRRQPQPLLNAAKYKHPRIRRQLPAIESNAQLLAANRWKIERQCDIFAHDGCGAPQSTNESVSQPES